MKSERPKITSFYFFTDSATAKKIVHTGFEGAGVWSHEGVVTILDRPPAPVEGAVLRVGLPPEPTAAALTHEESSTTLGARAFAVPIGLLRHAYIDIVDEASGPSTQPRDKRR
jgi:hypothetical protein